METPVLTQYSIVCQVPGAEPYTTCAYDGADLTQVLGITQTNLPGGHYGWILECGEAVVSVSGQTRAAYADFRPNTAKRALTELISKNLQEQAMELPSGALSGPSRDRFERLSQLPPLLMEDGTYCGLVREARDVFVDGHFYACVAMCGISFERFQRDKAKPHGAKQEDKMNQIRSILKEEKVLLMESLDLCERMATLRNKYAHGGGLHPKKDALISLQWMHSVINNETNLMRDYAIVNGILSRNRAVYSNRGS